MTPDTAKLIAQARALPPGSVSLVAAEAVLALAAALEAAEAQRDKVVRARNEIAATRDRAVEDYRSCKEEGSHADARRYDCVASTYSTALRLLDAALAAVEPPEEQP